jgi:hypothetical protein
MGIEGGQRGFDVFKNQTLVSVYKGIVAEEEEDWIPWQKELVPINDGYGCGLIEAVDCFSAGNPVRRRDGNRLDLVKHSLAEYLLANVWRPKYWADLVTRSK